MTPILILTTVFLYFAFLLCISFRAKRNASNAAFFSGNRQSRWYVVAFAMIGASISGVTFVSVPGMVAQSGFGYLQLMLGFIVGQCIIAYVLVPLFYRIGLTSVYEYLQNRFGKTSYVTGAWFFFLSKMLGAAVRLFLVCATLQLLAFGPLGIPFACNVAVSVFFVWLYTHEGGVKSVLWADTMKTCCLIAAVVLCIFFIANSMDLSFSALLKNITSSPMSHAFHFEDVNDKQYFWKQFLAGIFTMIATTGLDQDMMQRNLSCKNSRESQKNMLLSIVLQLIVVSAFLMLGVLLYQFAAAKGIEATGDKLFPAVATGGYLPLVVGFLFIIGLVASAYNAAGSALTALTTSFTLDVLGRKSDDEQQTTRTRKGVHIGMAVTMMVVILVFNVFNNTSVVDAVYTLASYTYGPILGLFAFGLLTHRAVNDRYIPLVAIASPLLCYFIDCHSEQWFNGYRFSYELLLMNALFTFVGLCLLIKKGTRA